MQTVSGGIRATRSPERACTFGASCSEEAPDQLAGFCVESGRPGRNNEVTIKYREHDGLFPLYTKIIRKSDKKTNMDRIVRFDELDDFRAFPGATRQVSIRDKLKTKKNGPPVTRIDLGQQEVLQ